jgi:hypothetical protein
MLALLASLPDYFTSLEWITFRLFVFACFLICIWKILRRELGYDEDDRPRRRKTKRRDGNASGDPAP